MRLMTIVMCMGFAIAAMSEDTHGTRERFEYLISWRGVPVASAVIVNEEPGVENTNQIFRSVRVVSRPWLKIFHPVNDVIECGRDEVGGRSRYSVRKTIHESGFHQEDVLAIDSGSGTAVWRDILNKREVSYPVPAGVRDYLSFLFDLRHADFPLGVPKEYQLVMDDGVRRLSVVGVCTGVVECARGAIVARKLEIKSLSSQLFVRNIPRSVWISETDHVMVVMEASTKLGVVRAVLQK